MNNKIRYSIVFLILSFFFCGVASALEKEQIYDEILMLHKEDFSYSKELKGYITKEGVRAQEYDEIARLSKLYKGTSVEKWWLIESGRLVFDDVIFSNSTIKSNYIQLLEKNQGSEKDTYITIKKELISIAEDIDIIFEESLRTIDKSYLYQKFYGREPSANEKTWLSNPTTIKYALYSGELGKEIDKSQKNIIDSGEGYKLLNITDVQYENYNKLLYLHQGIELTETKFIKTVYRIKDIRNVIQATYKLDIYNVLSKQEREDIYMQSVRNYMYDANIALKKVIQLLEKKNLIDTDKIPPPEPIKPPKPPKPPISDDFTKTNFFDDLQDAKIKNKNDKKFKILNSSVAELYKVRVQKLEGNYIYFSHEGKEYNTHVTVDKDKNLKKEDISNVLQVLYTKLDLKAVESDMKILFLYNHKFTVEDKIDIKDGEKMKFAQFKDFVQKIGISLYIKNINDVNLQTEDAMLNAKNNLKSGNYLFYEKNGIQYRLDIALKEDESIEEKNIEILSKKTGINCVWAKDKVMFIKNNKIEFEDNIKELKTNKIKFKKVQELFSKMGVKLDKKYIDINKN